MLLSSLISVDPGLIFWTSIIFIGLYFFLTRAAWNPIQKALKDRQYSIEDALKQAENARHEMAALNSKNEEILASAREERSRILKEAKIMSDNIIADAKEKSKVEAEKIIMNARQEINSQKDAALTEVKNTAGKLALEVAGKILRKQLVGNAEQERLASKLISEIELN